MYTPSALKPIRKLNYGKINLKRSSRILNDFNFKISNLGEIPEINCVEISHNISEFAAALQTIQNSCTSVLRQNRTTSFQHPWMNCHKYRKVIAIRKNLRKTLRLSTSAFSKALIRMANVNVRSTYNELKRLYYNKLVSGTLSNSTEFYNLMRTKRRPKSAMPLIMKFENVFYRGDEIMEKFISSEIMFHKINNGP